MNRISSLAIIFVVALTTLAGNVTAQQNSTAGKKAEAVADRAIADLAAWKIRRLGSTSKARKPSLGRLRNSRRPGHCWKLRRVPTVKRLWLIEE